MCVIGGGPVALSVGRRLVDRGARVVMLERGGMAVEAQAASLDVDFDSRPYGGASAGRAYGLGGTSALWGGQLLPAMKREVEGADGGDELRWPIRFGEIDAYYSVLDGWLGVDPGAFEITRNLEHPLCHLEWTGFAPRYSKWLAFGRRHIWGAWSKELSRAKNLQIWLNARVVGLEGGPRVRRIEARGPRSSVTVSAERVVIAAGAIESTKLALELFDAPELSPLRPAALGHYLHDHLSIRVARLAIIQPRRVRRLFSPVFLNGTMRSLRIELAPEIARSAGIPPAYAHIVAETDAHSGFAVVRDVLRALQRRHSSEALRLLGQVPAVLPELADLAFWRFAHHRLVMPKQAPTYLHVDLQQAPAVQNRIYLSHDRDPEGCRRVRIDWRASGDIEHCVSVFERHLRRFWDGNQLARAATLEFLPRPKDAALAASNAYDIYHPAGTTRMAANRESGCVDRDLRLFGTENVFIASTSVFPALGAANPTYTAMALGVRLADHLARGTI